MAHFIKNTMNEISWIILYFGQNWSYVPQNRSQVNYINRTLVVGASFDTLTLWDALALAT